MSETAKHQGVIAIAAAYEYAEVEDILFVVSFLFPILSVFFIGLNETERNMLKKGISLLMSKIGL